MAEKLGIGTEFPKISLRLVGGGEMMLPDDLQTSYAVVLFYRGHW